MLVHKDNLKKATLMLSKEEVLTYLASNKDMCDSNMSIIIDRLIKVESSRDVYRSKLVEADKIIRDLSPMLSSTEAVLSELASVAMEMISDELVEAVSEKV